MSERLHLNPDDSCKLDGADGPADEDFLDVRSRKRALLDEMSTGWEQGRPILAEELLPRWPGNASSDGDFASLLFEEYEQRRARGEDASLADIENRFPEQRSSLASLMHAHDVFRSLSGSSTSVPRLALPTVGDELFGFRMRHELGRGAFACVFLAEQDGLAGRPVVLKISAVEGNEPQTLAQLQHTNIVPIYSVHEDASAGLRVVCMPYFGGASLSAVLHAVWPNATRLQTGAELVKALEAVQAPPWALKRSDETPAAPVPAAPASTAPAPLTWLRDNSYFRAAAQLVAQLAGALDHAHERGILHRDIKPANILMAGDGTPMLLDFNLAEDINSPKARASATLGGTISYMAPEHLRALTGRSHELIRKVDHRSDIYSLGMVLYEMLVGQSPFGQSASYTPIPTLIESMAVERAASAPSLRLKRPDAPWDLESIVRKCLDPIQERRYQRAAHVAEDLEAFLHDLPLQHAPQLSRVERCRKWLRRHPRLASSGTVGTVAAVLLLTAGAALFSVRGHLQSAELQVEADSVRHKLRQHDAATLRALCLVNVEDPLDPNLRQGAEVCANALGLFGVRERANWLDDAALKHLQPDDRQRLAENNRELLLLLAWVRVRSSPGDEAVLRDALFLVDRAEAITGLEPTPALLEERAYYLEKLGNRTEAEAVRAQARKLVPVTARDYYLLASAYIRAGAPDCYDKALAALEEATRLNPKHYWSQLQIGLINVERHNFSDAGIAFGECIGLEPDFALGYYNLAYVLDQTGAKTMAIKRYTTAIKLDPAFALAYQNRAMIHLELGEYQEALTDLDAALALGRDEATVYAGRAMALEALKRHAESADAIATALARASDARVRRGEEAPAMRIRWTYGFAISTRLPERARQLFAEVLSRNPRHPQALYGLAMLETTADRIDEALRYFAQAVEAAPNFTDARRFRSVLLARRSRFAEALQEIDGCLAREPNSGPTLYAAACVAARVAEAKLPTNPLAAAEDCDRALAFLDRAFQMNYGPGRVDDDPDLVILRDHPKFQRFRSQPREPEARSKGSQPREPEARSKGSQPREPEARSKGSQPREPEARSKGERVAK